MILISFFKHFWQPGKAELELAKVSCKPYIFIFVNNVAYDSQNLQIYITKNTLSTFSQHSLRALCC